MQDSIKEKGLCSVLGSPLVKEKELCSSWLILGSTMLMLMYLHCDCNHSWILEKIGILILGHIDTNAPDMMLTEPSPMPDTLS